MKDAFHSSVGIFQKFWTNVSKYLEIALLTMYNNHILNSEVTLV